MATILIRDVPDQVHSSLLLEAERNRRSKEKQALFLIETGLRRKRPAKEVLEQARKIHDQCSGEISMESVLKFTEEAH